EGSIVDGWSGGVCAAAEWRRSRGVADHERATCFGVPVDAGARNFHVSALWVSRRAHFEFDAVRIAGDLAQDFRLCPTSGTEPTENSSQRDCVRHWNFCVVHRAGGPANLP